ncbi:MAG: uroporphyrinogen decarboxylase/cobalamine-independent methonine synthase family protein, partial [Planctomycetota bacterium]
ELEFLDDRTSWVRPFVADLSDYTPVFERSNKWWRYMCGLIDALCEVSEGQFLIGIPDLHGGGDSLSAVRHPDRLALDLYDEPEEVERIMRVLTDIYKEIFDDYYARISRVQQGSSTWLPAYSRGKYSALQDDFSGLISPQMFERFFLPYDIVALSEHLDNSLYHLDGPSALANLPYLLEVESLDGIQWEPGVADRPMTRWVDVCGQILEAGKCLQFTAAADEVEHMLGELPHAGLFISTYCETEAEGRDLLRRVEAMA